MDDAEKDPSPSKLEWVESCLTWSPLRRLQDSPDARGLRQTTIVTAQSCEESESNKLFLLDRFEARTCKVSIRLSDHVHLLQQGMWEFILPQLR